MRRIGMLFFGMVLIFAGTLSANALTFTDTREFSGTVKNGRDAMEIGANTTPFEFSFTHNVLFVPPADSITSAQIVLSHYDNSGTANGEVWFLYDGTTTPIGTLEQSRGTWNDQIFSLPASLYEAISGGSWSLALILSESTSGNDKLWIDKSVLSGDYNPMVDTTQTPPPTNAINAVPEPSTMILLGAGLVAIAGVRLRRKARS